MKELKFTRTHNAGQLLDELEAAVPALRSVTVGGERQAVFTLSSAGESITLLVPDGTGDSAVAAVITAHVPQAPVPPPDLRALWTTYKTNVQALTLPAAAKTVLINDLGALLRAMARGSRGDLNGS